jgi:hypothetical protein
LVVCELVRSGNYGANWSRVAKEVAFIPHGPPVRCDRFGSFRLLRHQHEPAGS